MITKKYLLSLAAVALLFTACKKDTTAKVSTTLKVPTIDIIGGDFTSVPIGTPYADAGATYTGEDGSASTITAATNDVTTADPGVYFVTYEQTSTSGIFNTTATRVVGVAYQDDPVDYSGTYLRTATGVNCYITKVAPGLYRVQNPGGAAGHESVVVYFVETGANTFDGPLQPNDVVGDIEIHSITFSDTGGSWALVNPYYGPAVRVFVKQ